MFQVIRPCTILACSQTFSSSPPTTVRRGHKGTTRARCIPVKRSADRRLPLRPPTARSNRRTAPWSIDNRPLPFCCQEPSESIPFSRAHRSKNTECLRPNRPFRSGFRLTAGF